LILFEDVLDAVRAESKRKRDSKETEVEVIG
jgi:hypothetical protein